MAKAQELNPVISYMESIGSTWALFYISGNMDKTIDRFLDAELAEPPETKTGIATKPMQQKLVELINEHYVQPNQARLLNLVRNFYMGHQYLVDNVYSTWHPSHPDWSNDKLIANYESDSQYDWLSYRLEISLMDMKRAYVTAQYKVANDDTPYTDTEFLSTFNDPGATFWHSLKEESQ